MTTYADEAAERYAYVRELLLRAVPPPARLVELGAAPGEQSVGLARAGYRVTAVDLGEAEWSDRPEGSMRSRLDEAGVDLVLWDLERTPYPFDDETFDVVVLTEVVEHLREYPARSLAEACRILRRGGVLVLTTPNAAYLRNRLMLLRGRSVYTPLRDWLHGLPHARHAREYTKLELEVLIREAGLTPVSVTARHFYRSGGNRTVHARLAKAVVDAIARRVPTLGPSLIVVARRPN